MQLRCRISFSLVLSQLQKKCTNAVKLMSYYIILCFLVLLSSDRPDCVQGRLCFVFYSSLKNLKEVYICPAEGQKGPVRGQVRRTSFNVCSDLKLRTLLFLHDYVSWVLKQKLLAFFFSKIYIKALHIYGFWSSVHSTVFRIQCSLKWFLYLDQ